MKHLLICLLLVTGCRECPKQVPPFTKWDVISGREEMLTNEVVMRPLYRAKISEEWHKIENEDLTDTTKPNVTYIVEDKVKICVHSFPANSLEERIFPGAQVERWKNQLGKGSGFFVEPISRGGFYGFFFEGEKEENKVLAWAMQLDLEHYQTLQFLATSQEEKEYYRQMQSDFTIKITGPKGLIEKHRLNLLLFAESLELIREIPEKV